MGNSPPFLGSAEPTFLLSIVTVTKNCEETLQSTLSSVRSVKSEKLQYVVIDGASSDGTLQLIQSAQDIVDVFVSEPDQGIYDAMNKGVALASGEYVLFLNSDDQLLPEAFLSAISTLPHPQRGVVSFASVTAGQGSGPTALIPRPRWLSIYNSIPHPSTFTPTVMLRQFPFDTRYRIAADYDFFLRAYLRGVHFETHNDAIAVYHLGGASANVGLAADEVAEVQRLHLPRHLLLLRRFVVTLLELAFRVRGRFRSDRRVDGPDTQTIA